MSRALTSSSFIIAAVCCLGVSTATIQNTLTAYASRIVLLLCSPLSGNSEICGQRANNFTPGSCTIFTVVKGKAVFFGNNEDWFNPFTF